MKQLILSILILFQLDSFSQTGVTQYNFSHLIAEAKGDLNKDDLPDKVVVTQDTVHQNAPYRLQVFFKEPGGKWKLAVTSTQIIIPQYPEGRGGYLTGNEFAGIEIKNRVLSVNVEFLRGHSEHKFRFQNGNFELIGVSSVSSDGIGKMTATDFNLSTGIRTEEVVRYDTDEVLSNKKEKILIKPLPKLQDVIPFANTLY